MHTQIHIYIIHSWVMLKPVFYFVIEPNNIQLYINGGTLCNFCEIKQLFDQASGQMFCRWHPHAETTDITKCLFCHFKGLWKFILSWPSYILTMTHFCSRLHGDVWLDQQQRGWRGYRGKHLAEGSALVFWIGRIHMLMRLGEGLGRALLSIEVEIKG